ncbi:MmgE/PrpD family protein [Paraferrimonas sedimenticola]|uniref:2-methylcitrate dehydratase n=1 Tax=Paraferrimonas sedimenticola TaxID=375674 RepID=A0AA37RWF7_9GAMM|nr:MmgE/PrpD family protein [Paraferrimonas sedimenticola]GLP96318.1 2-methylcitrate dehydratase [Paraferrimonas sedimenticola]
MKAIDAVVNFVEQQSFETLPQSAIDAALMFIMDSIGVGLSGTRVANRQRILEMARQWGEPSGPCAQVWGSGEWLPVSNAAMVNAYQIHNQEWDCVHERAVVHPMASVLSSMMAYAQGHELSGRQLILGVVVGVEVATLIGACASTGLKFFRPSVCGGIGSAAGICAMLGLKGDTLKNALGIAYSSASGTMQAHVEGSPMLALQVALNARSATQSVDFARSGFSGPHDILEGEFGYFNLFEDQVDPQVLIDNIGRDFQITQLSHKPFPTGRAGHGTVDGLQQLQQEYGFEVSEISAIHVAATPLINRLVGRPIKPDMDVAYAKLCNGYIAATSLLTGNVSVTDFDPEPMRDAERQQLGAKLTTSLNDCQDPNALAPVTVRVTLNNGQSHSVELPAILGHPQRPLSAQAQIEKFYAACLSATPAPDKSQVQVLLDELGALPELEDVNSLVKTMTY